MNKKLKLILKNLNMIYIFTHKYRLLNTDMFCFRNNYNSAFFKEAAP